MQKSGFFTILFIGVLIVVYGAFLADEPNGTGWMGVGVGLAGLAFGIEAWAIARNSDKVMDAIVNLEFDEKATMINVTSTALRRVGLPPIERAQAVETLIGNFEAIYHLKEWISDVDRKNAVAHTVIQTISQIQPVSDALGESPGTLTELRHKRLIKMAWELDP